MLKTVDEVTAVMGCPPGVYAKRDYAYMFPPDLSANVIIRGEIVTWVADDCMIVVRKDRDGTVVYTWLVRAR